VCLRMEIRCREWARQSHGLDEFSLQMASSRCESRNIRVHGMFEYIVGLLGW
jgi:hypothetical protein